MVDADGNDFSDHAIIMEAMASLKENGGSAWIIMSRLKDRS